MMTPDSHTASTNPHFALMRVSRNAALLRQSLGSEMKYHGPGNGLCHLLYAAQQLEREIKCYLKYDPNQPRVPAGSSDGGQWTAVGSSGGGSGSTGAETGTGRSFKPVYDGEPDEPIEAVYPIEDTIGLLFGGQALGSARSVLGSQRARLTTQLTGHGVLRSGQRAITNSQVNKAIHTAKKTGAIVIKTGKYGTPQKIYRGTNGITVIVETTGRNAGKVITLYRH